MKWRMFITVFFLFSVMLPLTCLSSQEESSSSAFEEKNQPALTDEEWREVNDEGNPVKRVRKLLEVAADRLSLIRTIITQEQFAEATILVETYTPIITYTMTFIDEMPEKERKKQRNAYKEFDLRIRKQIQTLEELRRTFPANNQAIEDSLVTVRRLRIIALNRFSGDKIFKVPER